MAKKSKRRSKQAKRRAQKRATHQEPAPISAADRLLTRIRQGARTRREVSAQARQQGQANALRVEERRRARGLDNRRQGNVDWDDEL